MPPLQVAAAGILIDVAAALAGDMILVLVGALWERRGGSRAVAAIVGAALADLVLVAIGGGLGWLLVFAVGDPVARATIAIGAFVGVGARSAIGLLLGASGVPAGAQLPSSPILTLLRFFAITLLTPTTALIALAAVVAWPRTWVFGAAWAFVAGIAIGAAGFRLVWGGHGTEPPWNSFGPVDPSGPPNRRDRRPRRVERRRRATSMTPRSGGAVNRRTTRCARRRTRAGRTIRASPRDIGPTAGIPR